MEQQYKETTKSQMAGKSILYIISRTYPFTNNL